MPCRQYSDVHVELDVVPQPGGEDGLVGPGVVVVDVGEVEEAGAWELVHSVPEVWEA